MTSSDQIQRQQALNANQSFIVQAPAGSGKTELLIQRFLVLLGQVKKPEEILSITFTKKAAAEMRERILAALNNAREQAEPTTPHQQITWRLAKKVLARDQELNWQLLFNPNRLQVKTIDAFNVMLTKQLPMLSHFGASPDITIESLPLYREAVQRMLEHLEGNSAWSEAIAQLLLHLDNNLEQVENLLITMLQKRDQWLQPIAMHSTDETLREKLESHLKTIIQNNLSRVETLFPKEYRGEIFALRNFAAQNLKMIDSQSIITDDTQFWYGVAELLLTKEFNWRKRFDKNLGFPPSENAAEKTFLANMKQRMSELVYQLQDNEELRFALKELVLSPQPTYQEQQWETLQALHQVLLLTVGELKLIFRTSGKIDYIENAQAALMALGTEETPTDLALALDYKIQHILIDEFQDTSYSQYRLLEKLILGWQPGDGRTLFVVGDPMQSIYRFREAEVGLFIRARQKGIGNLQLQSLTLSNNFRSSNKIVEWINQHFVKIFPSKDAIESGAVSFSSSVAFSGENQDSNQVYLNNAAAENQAHEIINLVKQTQANNPQGTIAILVRSRSHLTEIIAHLKTEKIAYQAIDIDPLSSRPVTQDLLALTRALLNPADRIAWLAILRAPWCGLALNDLLIIAGESSKTIWEQLHAETVINQLSDEGQKRLRRILPILQMKIANRYRERLRQWVEKTWMLLGGPACIEEEYDLADAQEYFNLISTWDENGNFIHPDQFEEKIQNLYAAANTQADIKLQIMTIHNAKGLEFDTVILPHLERRTSADDKQLLLWMELTSLEETSSLIFAPVHGVGAENDSIYEYIKRQHVIKSDFELARLLYVAITRAKKSCHLFFDVEQDENGEWIKPASNSLLDKLWPAIVVPNKHPSPLIPLPTHQNRHCEPAFFAGEAIQKDPSGLLRRFAPRNDGFGAQGEGLKVRGAGILKRLALDWQNPFTAQDEQIIAYHQQKSGFNLPQNQHKIIGTLVHKILQQICLQGPHWWQNNPQENLAIYIKNNLLQLGLLTNQIKDASKQVQQAITNILSDERGQWIIKPHRAAETEFSITTVVNNMPKTFVIDRTFIDEYGTRWIIDYKTASFDGDNLDEFFATEQKKYAAQMENYAQALQLIDKKVNLRLGLYFPLIHGWKEF